LSAQYCGNTFLDGQIPSTVQEWSENATSSAPAVTSSDSKIGKSLVVMACKQLSHIR
jgi:hypothetical protein